MSITFHPPEEAVNMVMEQLKTERMVHPEAIFNPSAPGGLRREVTYRDGDFAWRLGNTVAEARLVRARVTMPQRTRRPGGRPEISSWTRTGPDGSRATPRRTERACPACRP